MKISISDLLKSSWCLLNVGVTRPYLKKKIVSIKLCYAGFNQSDFSRGQSEWAQMYYLSALP